MDWNAVISSLATQSKRYSSEGNKAYDSANYDQATANWVVANFCLALGHALAAGLRLEKK